MNDWRAVRAEIDRISCEFQAHWHDRFDEDDELVDDGRPDPLPRHVDEDHRLVFGIEEVTSATRAACYEVFPSGGAMLERFESFRKQRAEGRPDLSDSDAEAVVAEIASRVVAVASDAAVDWSVVQFAFESEAGVWERMNRTDQVHDLIEASLHQPDYRLEPAASAARLFLSEPHYFAAGNSYEPHRHVTGILYAQVIDEIYDRLYRLFLSGRQVFCDDGGVLVVQRSV